MSSKKDRKKLYKLIDHKATKVAFNRLAANLKFYCLNKNVKTISITSSIKDEGKTTVAASLATCLTENNSKVLLVDTDIHHKSLTSIFKSASTQNVQAVLAGACPLEKAIDATEIKNLYFFDCASGVASLPEVISSKEFNGIWEAVCNAFDFIVVDTAPILPCTEASLVCKLTDACVQVVKQGVSKKEDVLSAFEQLKSFDVNVIGTVLNFSKGKEYKYYSSYKYN